MYRNDTTGGVIRRELDVLIVEDEPVSRKALTALVAARGYHTDAAPSAEDALRKVARDGLPKIALVDLDLPGMSGIEFIQRLEQLGPGVFPVLITAAAGDVVDDIRRRYPVAYLRKPLDFDRLMSMINERQKRSEVH
jgi:CheY-like chemotaxis protein